MQLIRCIAVGVIATVCAAWSSGGRSETIDVNVWINEFHYDNDGGDVGEFVEVVARNGAVLGDFTLSLYNGSGGGIYGTPTTLDLFSPGATVGDFTFYSLNLPVNGLQNGSPDGLALTHSTAGVLQFLSYEGVFGATNGLASGSSSTDVGVFEDGSTPIGHSLQLTGSGNSYAEFTWVAPNTHTNGGLNLGQTFTPVDLSENPDAAPPPPPATPTTSLVINEFLADPDATAGDANGSGGVDTSADEFVEIINTGASAADLSNFTLSDAFGVRHVFPEGTVVPAGGSLLVFGSDENGDYPHWFAPAFGGAIAQQASTGMLGLNNAGDTITLTEVNTSVAAALTYPDANVAAGGNDQSVTRDPDISGGTLVQHSTAVGAGGALFSPGTRLDGTPFTTDDFDHVLPVAPGGATTIDFAGYNGSGLAKNPAAGQLDSDVFRFDGFSDATAAFFGMTATSGDLARGASSGGVGPGGVYAFEVAPGDMALGVQPTGSDFNAGALSIRLLNTTAGMVDNLSLDYVLWVYNDADRSSSVDLEYSGDGLTFFSGPSLLTPEAADDTPSWVATPFSLELPGIEIAPGGFLFLRFLSEDVSGSGSRDEVALNNLVVSWQLQSTIVPEPMTWTLALIAAAAVALLLRRPAV